VQASGAQAADALAGVTMEKKGKTTASSRWAKATSAAKVIGALAVRQSSKEKDAAGPEGSGIAAQLSLREMASAVSKQQESIGRRRAPTSNQIVSQLTAPASSLDSRTGTGAMQLATRLPTVFTFTAVLMNIGAHCYPEEAEADRISALQKLCNHVLRPLRARLPETFNILEGVKLIKTDEALRNLLRHGRHGLAAFFGYYATGMHTTEPYKRGYWTIQAVCRAANDVNLVSELSHSQMHQLFACVTSYEADRGRGDKSRLSFCGFHLLLVVISELVHQDIGDTPRQRLAVFFMRIGALGAPGSQELRNAARSLVPRPQVQKIVMQRSGSTSTSRASGTRIRRTTTASSISSGSPPLSGGRPGPSRRSNSTASAKTVRR